MGENRLRSSAHYGQPFTPVGIRALKHWPEIFNTECRRAQDAKRDFPVPLSPCARRQPWCPAGCSENGRFTRRIGKDGLLAGVKGKGGCGCSWLQ